MKHVAVNPYLPLYEYIPDGEPRLFDGRVYVYGSHDTAGGDYFCQEDYVVWSAPEGDLGNWRYEGVTYHKDQDPSNLDGKLELFAPDVVRGTDGRYYLYYCLRLLPEFGVAVSDSPAGPFTFYGHVHWPNGATLADYMPYDPSVLVDDDGGVYLYYGFSSSALAQRYHTEISPGAMVVKLEPDMLTVNTAPKSCIPWEGLAEGSSFEGHAYFEAPSMRKIKGKYYLVYSSQWWHELCYAVSDRPDEGFTYGGVIVDNTDIGFHGRTLPVCIPGNNHGGLVCANDTWYLFYHRHTSTNAYSRQGCAEQVQVLPDGSIPQVEVTSCGLNGAPLPAKGEWPAAISCQLYGDLPEKMLDLPSLNRDTIPYITETGTGGPASQQFIHNLQNSSVVGYKYFNFTGDVSTAVLWLRGDMRGTLRLCLDEPNTTPVAKCQLQLGTAEWRATTLVLPASMQGSYGLYFLFDGTGKCDFLRFVFS